MTALIRTGTAASLVYANWSRWVAHCGFCRFGRAALQPYAPNFDCGTCGKTTDVIWPAEDMVAGVERLLMMRPDPSTRNWHPGETLIDLAFENAQHGIFDGLTGTPGESLLSLSPDRIRRDNLPALKPRTRQEITP